MSNKEAVPTNAREYQSDRRLEEMEHDPYRAKMKLNEPTRLYRLRRGLLPWPLDLGRGTERRAPDQMPRLPAYPRPGTGGVPDADG